MLHFSPIYRIKVVFKTIGKPLYWAGIFVVSSLLYLRQAGKSTSHPSTRIKVIVSTHQKKIHIKSHRNQRNFLTSSRVLTEVGVFLCTALGIMIASTVGMTLFYIHILKNLPAAALLLHLQPNLTTKIYDRNHTLLYKIYQDEDRTLVHLSDVPKVFLDATVSTEDKEFYYHHGFSVRGIGRALRVLITQGKIQGGSTITQQLVKTTLLSRERTLTRKIKEIILAVQVERILPKQRILEMYINEVSYGGTSYGVEAASQRYFGIPAKNLSLAQSAFLAGLPASPTTFSPAGISLTPAINRQHEVLKRMVEDGKITPLEAETARQETLHFSIPTNQILAPHFVMYVKDFLTAHFGKGVVEHGGLEVRTTLDLPLQSQTEHIVSDEVDQLKSLRVTNGAALITNPRTGEILSMVGSHNYFDIAHDGQVNVTLRPRQPGSSIKPLMYSAALSHGFTPATILDDSPISYPMVGGPPYTPRNYDGTYHGKEPLRFALANSHNVPAVKTEAAIGLPTFIDNARALGITTWNDASRFGLSLTLGAGEVLMTDMATAYGVFSNAGERVDLTPLLEVTDSESHVLYVNPCLNSTATVCQGHKVLDPGIAYQITNILSDNTARSRAFGLHSVLFIPNQEVAVKTGTTNSLRDNWTIGYTTERLVATWVGNNDNTPMSHVTSGITGASPIWNKIMRGLLDDEHPHTFPVPNNLVAMPICAATGQPSCGACGDKYTEYFLPDTAPQAECPSNALAQDSLPSPSPTPLPHQYSYQSIPYTHILDGITTQQ